MGLSGADLQQQLMLLQAGNYDPDAILETKIGRKDPVKWVADVDSVNNSQVNFEHANPTGGYLQHLYTGAGSAGGALYAAGVGDGGPTSTNGYLASLKNTATGHGYVAVNQPNSSGSGFYGEHQSTIAALLSLRSVNSAGTAAPIVELIADGTPGANQKIQRWLSSSVNYGDFGTTVFEVRTDGTVDSFGILRSNGGRFRVQTRDSGGTGLNISKSDWLVEGDESKLRMSRTIGGGEKYFMYEVASGYDKAHLRAAHYDSMSAYANAVSWGITGAAGAATLGFFGAPVVAKPSGVAVTAAGVHAALVTLGLISA